MSADREHVVTVDPRAIDTIEAMCRQAAAIERTWTSHCEYGVKAQSSLATVLSRVLIGGFGPTKVFRDGDVSLLLDAGITIGVIFHRKHIRVKAPVPGDIDMSWGAPYAGRYCMADVEKEGGDLRYCGKPFTDQGDQGTPTCIGHNPFPVTMPIPGDWSMHS